MKRKLFAHKHGDLQSGNWQWALAAEDNIGNRPLIVATFNFYGAVAAGYDPEILSQQLADLINKEIADGQS